MLSESPDLRWFENTERKCNVCKKRATGILRDSHNASWGPHCTKCAERRLRHSKMVREAEARGDRDA